MTGAKELTEVFHYAGPGDSPSWTARGTAWTRNIIGIGGELAAIQDSVAGTSLQLTNLHGDVVATASLSQTATKPTATFEFDEFGNPKQSSTPRFGWLGGKLRRAELPSGVIQMGVRSYVPVIGRFISTDPVLGGSANAYDYVAQDPVNGFDLTGEVFCNCGSHDPDGINRKRVRRIVRAVRHANRQRNKHRILPFIVCHHCSEHSGSALDAAGDLVSSWSAPIRHWTRDRAEELANAAKGAASSIPCSKIGLALGGSGVILGAGGLATVWIPGVGETLLLVGAGVDLGGVAADLLHEKGVC